jgi:pyruvate/2-oxoglutarate dehydrogenase complex dihydrolipoamide acyltransferase (E2) component
LESPATGVITEILHAEDSVIEVRSPIAVIKIS